MYSLHRYLLPTEFLHSYPNLWPVAHRIVMTRAHSARLKIKLTINVSSCKLLMKSKWPVRNTCVGPVSSEQAGSHVFNDNPKIRAVLNPEGRIVHEPFRCHFRAFRPGER